MIQNTKYVIVTKSLKRWLLIAVFLRKDVL